MIVADERKEEANYGFETRVCADEGGDEEEFFKMKINKMKQKTTRKELFSSPVVRHVVTFVLDSFFFFQTCSPSIVFGSSSIFNVSEGSEGSRLFSLLTRRKS